MKKYLLPTIAIALMATSAQAAVIDWGTHDPIETGGSLIPAIDSVNTGFSDIFTFTISAGSMLATSAEVRTMPLTIVGGTYALVGYGLDNTLGTIDDSVLGQWVYGADTGSIVHNVAVGPGRYLYTVSGVATGPDGGAYSITSIVSAVPEPGTVVLLMTGLATVGLLRLRSRR